MRREVAATLMVAGVVAATALAGCRGGDDGGGSTADVPATTTDAPATTTTTSSTSTTSTTSTTTSTSTTTTEAPPPTDPPEPTLDELEAEIAAAYDLIYEGYWACLRSPLDCDTSWLVEGSGSAEAMQATMQGLADRDRFVGDDPVGYYVIEDIEINGDATEATVVSCWWSTAVLYTTPIDPTRPPGPDNPPTIVNDTPGSSVQADTVTLTASGWAVMSSETISRQAEVNKCSD